MRESAWEGLMEALKSNFQAISAVNSMRNQFISIFKFNNNTTAVCEYESPVDFDFSRIVFGSGGTAFGPAFKKGY